MDKKTRKDLELVFFEAHVVDADLSNWDWQFRLVVWSMAFQSFYEVDFLDFTELTWKSFHVGRVPRDSRRHCQWHISEFAIEDTSDGYLITLCDSGGPEPLVTIGCRDVAIAALPERVVKDVRYEWKGSPSALDRPGIEELAKTIRRLKRLQG